MIFKFIRSIFFIFQKSLLLQRTTICTCRTYYKPELFFFFKIKIVQFFGMFHNPIFFLSERLPSGCIINYWFFFLKKKKSPLVDLEVMEKVSLTEYCSTQAASINCFWTQGATFNGWWQKLQYIYIYTYLTCFHYLLY